MAGPGDAVAAKHAFADRSKLSDRRLAAQVATVGPNLDAKRAAGEGVFEHQQLHFWIDHRRPRFGTKIGRSDLKLAMLG